MPIKEISDKNLESNTAIGRILKRMGDRFLVHRDQQEVVCSVRKTVTKSDLSPVVGDWVRYTPINGDSGVIEEVRERTSSLTRSAAGPKPRPQVLLANLDLLVVVASVAEPEPNHRLIDRFLVMAEFSGIEAVIVWNKVDLLVSTSVIPPLESPPGTGGEMKMTPSLPPPAIRQRRTSSRGEEAAPPLISPPGIGGDRLLHFASNDTPPLSPPTEVVGETVVGKIYQHIGYRNIFTCAFTGQGVEALREHISGKTSMFIGASGVGKTSLLNQLQPGLAQKIAAISQATGKGTHATSTTEIFPLNDDTFIADSPGVREFAMWGVSRQDLGWCFREFVPLIPNCRFRDCLHDQEIGCAVKEAVVQGIIEKERWESYVRILRSI